MTRSMIVLIVTAAGLTAGQQPTVPMINMGTQRAIPSYIEHAIVQDSSTLDSLIRDQMNSFYIPGAQTMVLKNGQIIWNVPFGYTYVQDSIPVTDSTMFTIMSVSKTMVAWAVMQLWERGVIGLDDNINDHLPFQVIHPLYPDSVITIRMLMCHTAGLRDWVSLFYQLISWGQDSPISLSQFLRDYFVPGGQYYDPNNNFSPYAPGTRWEYCNAGACLLAYMVEYLADSFPVYTRDSIFNPLSMPASRWFLSELDTMDIAMPYDWNGSSYYPYGHYGHPCYPMGFLRTNTSELIRSLQAFMQHGQIDGVRILDSATVELMTTVQYPAIEPTQGLIWYRLWRNGREIWGHEGGWLGSCTIQFYCPAENTGVIVLTNIDGFYNDLHMIGVWNIGDLLFDYVAEYGIDENGNEKPAGEFCLFQNRPNPFRSTTRIEFELYARAKVGLEVYNIAGQRVARVAEREFPSGRHEVNFNAGDLPSGVYYYSLKCGGSVRTRPCVLSR